MTRWQKDQQRAEDVVLYGICLPLIVVVAAFGWFAGGAS